MPKIVYTKYSEPNAVYTEYDRNSQNKGIPIIFDKNSVYRILFFMTKQVYTKLFLPNSVYTQYDRNCQKRCIAKFGVYPI